MRYAAAILFLTACAPSLPPAGVAGVLLDEPLTACVRTVTRGESPVDDLSTLHMETSGHSLEVTWRGEVDRWYPVTVPGDVDGHPCALTVDASGAWIVTGECGGVSVYAEATACQLSDSR